MVWLWSLAPAFGCSVACEGTFGPPSVVVPRDGEQGVPTDAAPVVRGDDGVMLVDETGEPVETIRQELAVGVTALRPRLGLAPGATYAVVAGEEVLATFTTGDGPSEAEPEAIGDVEVVGRISKDLLPGTSLTAMCGNLGDGVWIDASWAPTTGLYEVRAERADGPTTTFVVTEETARLGWTTPCVATLPDLEPGEAVTVSVRAIDVTGRVGAFSDPLETTARAAGGGCATGAPHGTAGGLLIALLAVVSRRRTS